MHAQTIDAEVVVVGADADERAEGVEDDDVIVVIALVAHGFLHVSDAHVGGDVAVDDVAMETDVQVRLDMREDVMARGSDALHGAVLATLNVNGQRVPLDVTVDADQIGERAQIKARRQGNDVKRPDLRNGECGVEGGRVEAGGVKAGKQVFLGGNCFARSVATLNGLLGAIKHDVPVDRLLSRGALECALAKVVCDEADETQHALAVEVGVNEKGHDRVFDAHSLVSEVDEVFKQSEADE